MTKTSKFKTLAYLFVTKSLQIGHLSEYCPAMSENAVVSICTASFCAAVYRGQGAPPGRDGTLEINSAKLSETIVYKTLWKSVRRRGSDASRGAGAEAHIANARVEVLLEDQPCLRSRSEISRSHFLSSMRLTQWWKALTPDKLLCGSRHQ